MLRITVEFVPFGNEDKKEEIGKLIIGNIGKKNEHEEYKYSYTAEWKEQGEDRIRNVTGTVRHDRRNSWWFLLYKIVIKIIKPFKYIL